MKESRGTGGIEIVNLLGLDRDHTRCSRQVGRLVSSQFDHKSVEAVAVIISLAPTTDAVERLVMAVVQVANRFDDVRVVWIDLLTFFGLVALYPGISPR